MWGLCKTVVYDAVFMSSKVSTFAKGIFYISAVRGYAILGKADNSSARDGTSGWLPFGHLNPLPNPDWMNTQREKIRQAMILEDRLRLGPAAQVAYSKATTLDEVRKVTEDIQRQALEQAGIDSDFWISLDTLRRARFFFKDDPTMNQLTVYQRWDKSQPGLLHRNSRAPDVPLHALDGSEIKLRTLHSRLNKGLTISWANGLSESFKGEAHLICVYILEAHAQDEHANLQERLDAAKRLQSSEFDFPPLQLPVYVDSMSNAFNKAYAAWPERFFVIDIDGDIAYIAHPHDEWGFNRQRVELDARRSIRTVEVNDADRSASAALALSAANCNAFAGSRDLYRRLNLNSAVTLTPAKFNTIWLHYDKSRNGFLPQPVALQFLQELSAELHLEYNEDRAMVIIESCNSPTKELSKKMFEKVFAIWSGELGVSLSENPTETANPDPASAKP